MTRPIVIDIPHRLGVAEAKARIDAGFGKLESQFGAGLAKVDRSWSGDRMSFSARLAGQALSGRLDVLDEAVRLEVDLPPMLAALGEALKGRLEKQATLLLEKK